MISLLFQGAHERVQFTGRLVAFPCTGRTHSVLLQLQDQVFFWQRGAVDKKAMTAYYYYCKRKKPTHVVVPIQTNENSAQYSPLADRDWTFSLSSRLSDCTLSRRSFKRSTSSLVASSSNCIWLFSLIRRSLAWQKNNDDQSSFCCFFFHPKHRLRTFWKKYAADGLGRVLH